MHKNIFNYPLSYASALEHAVNKFHKAGISNPVIDAKALLCGVSDFSNAMLILRGDDIIPQIELEKFWKFVKRRLSGEPIAYILKGKEFWSLDFSVDNSTLIPRPDSEILVEAVIDFMREIDIEKPKILDLGTGSGCLLIAILSELPEAVGFGVDISKAASKVAKTNAKRHDLDSRAFFFVGDWAKPINSYVDLIISNPPYIKNQDRKTLVKDIIEFEPNKALFAGKDGLDSYRAIASDIRRILHPGGRIFVEIGAGQSEEVKKIFYDKGFYSVGTWHDLAGIERCMGFATTKLKKN